MKKVFYILFFFAIIKYNAQSRAVELKFDVKNQDCSGVGIEQIDGKVLASQHKKNVFSNQTIYMYKNGKCVDSLVTDSLGWVRRKIRSGTYDLFLPYKHKRAVPIKAERDFDMECMKKDWLQPDGTLKVSRKGVVFVNKGIGIKKCDWNYNCLKERHIPAGSQG
jgi:hypothetical protein